MERDELNRTLAWLDLRNDAVFNKIPPDRYRYYLDNALAAGAAAAQEFAGQSIRELYQQHDIDIQFDQGDGLFFTVQFRAQFEFSEKKATRRVTLYQPSLESLQASSGLPLEKIIDIHLAHEFFHFLEYSRKQPVGKDSRKYAMSRWAVPPLLHRGRRLRNRGSSFLPVTERSAVLSDLL
ncbi:hypothetical protein CEW81_23660 [Kluyvera genomosp. 3]|uniref:Uncharacterized protein n=1 Tax=Kluyvera genomosp. 3 TaxID=2774055 RepID=A0A248KL40_9ENTR|nr:hypothetical protein CEW81_23660 [Kluyvera genomosp. 3]